MPQPSHHDYEKLGAFYLGKLYDLENKELLESPLLYDSRDLTTHAVCVGMTGSGKTGLCLSLLEEAAIDGIPAIAIDPKGDLGNLLLTFPELRPEDFRPWIDESAAARRGVSPDEFARDTAETWRKGLAAWNQPPERIARFREAVDLAIYTPGSSAGLPLTVLKCFAAPDPALSADGDALRERISSSVSGLLSLLGIEADPVRSREHILLSNLFDHAWRNGRDLDVAGLIGEIRKPPFDRVGVVDLESFFPARERTSLAMSLNNLLASPSFSAWMQGEPLDIHRLLYTPEGKPRLSILSIAHLSEAERMFFVTIVLNEVLAWVRTQPGTSSLRALLYMDEVFGYFPPVRNPPSKTPMLTLLKQARAYGLGVVLATQNPVDLDYKGLSNTGTWLLGRLQTERDKARVLDGLQGASLQAGSRFDRKTLEATLSGLGSRVFLMNNVHEDQPVVFQTRWAMSYLRGPLTRTQIQTLMEHRKQVQPDLSATATAPRSESEIDLQPVAEEATGARAGSSSVRPLLPASVPQHFLAVKEPLSAGRILYRPALLGAGRLHYVRVSYKIDTWQSVAHLVEIRGHLPLELWEESRQIEYDVSLFQDQPVAGAAFAEVPADMLNEKNYNTWLKQYQSYLYRSRTGNLWRCVELKQFSELDESEGDFRLRIAHCLRERRDQEVEKLRGRYASRLNTLQGRIRTARERLDQQQARYSKSRFDSAVSFGSSILGALLGRKLASSTNVSRVGTSARSLGRTRQQREGVTSAEGRLEDLQRQLEEMEAEFDREARALEGAYQPEAITLEPLELPPRKSDMETRQPAVLWCPWQVDADGIAERAY